MAELKAVIFDCDGVLAETERDGHRVAFNQVFNENGMAIQWDIDDYGELVKVAGGKERMKYYFDRNPDKINGKLVDAGVIKSFHKRKTEIFAEMSEKGLMPDRQGVKRIIDEAHAQGIMLFVCSTSNKNSVTALAKALFGEERFGWFKEIYAGDVVKAKKPAPDIYNLVIQNNQVKGNECVVIEDSRNGLLAAKGAEMNCIITVSYYSKNENFAEADMVVSSLGEPSNKAIEVIMSSKKIEDAPSYITLEDMRKLV